MNPPTSREIRFRVGTWQTFLRAMTSRLGLLANVDGTSADAHGDPAVAFLDAFAVTCDVLSFYQERIANEGYIDSALEQRSVRALAALVGYTATPGVAASAFLAYTVRDPAADGVVPIAAGSQVRSIPESGGLPQVFETAVALQARASWNLLTPRLASPQRATPASTRLYFKGVATALQPNDLLLLACPGAAPQDGILRVVDVEPDFAHSRTRVDVSNALQASPVAPTVPAAAPLAHRKDILASLAKAAARHPRSPASMEPDVAAVLGPASDTALQLLGALDPSLRGSLYVAIANSGASNSSTARVVAFRGKAAPFGHAAPHRGDTVDDAGRRIRHEWTLHRLEQLLGHQLASATPAPAAPTPTETARVVSLDGQYDRILAGSWVLVERPDVKPFAAQVVSVRTESRSDYGIVGRTTRVEIDRPWLGPEAGAGATEVATENFSEVIRGTTIYVESVSLELVDAPVETPVQGDELELDILHGGLEPGRWLIVSGERCDVPGTAGIAGAEVVMLANSVVKEESSPATGGRPVTLLKLSAPLSYRYVRETVRIHGNVVRATHGETRLEVLGSGDASRPHARFTLRQGPLTHLAAATPSGGASTLHVRVNGVSWHAAEGFEGLAPRDRRYVATTDVQGRTQVMFGDGIEGARPATGVDNIRAVYRVGLGKSGNVGADRLSQLASQPLGVTGVVNPVAASGGADPESEAETRCKLPLTLKTLDRLVSTGDYADFARRFAGVGKASAARLPIGARRGVIISVSGRDESTIDVDSGLRENLACALRDFGSPHLPVIVLPAEKVLLLIVARVRIAADSLWDDVAPAVRQAVLTRFGFEHRDIAQDATPGGVSDAIHGVPGVEEAEIVRLDATVAGDVQSDLARLFDPSQSSHRPLRGVRARAARIEAGRPRAAQIVFLSAAVRSALILSELA